MASHPGTRKWLIVNGGRLCVCLLALVAAMAAGGLLAGDGRAQSEGLAYSFELNGEIDRTTRRELERALEDAESKGARLVIVRLDTPGGELEATRQMVSTILAAPLPVVVYVAPDGAHAASAGVFLTVAGDVAAMAPQTNIGSASPIVGGPQGVAEVPPTLRRKVLNDLAAYVRTLAEGHDRNADLAERMVRQATNVTAREAGREGLIDLVAGSQSALLERLDGFRVKGRKAQVLRTAGLRLEHFDQSASADEKSNVPGDGALVLGLGLPGLIALAMAAAVIAIVVGQTSRRRLRRRWRRWCRRRR